MAGVEKSSWQLIPKALPFQQALPISTACEDEVLVAGPGEP